MEGETETRLLHVLDKPLIHYMEETVEPYPFGFDPTYCRYKLDGPASYRKPSNVFVCSMGDLFGPWFTDGIIGEVEQAARAVPRHNYFFLTKFPARYNALPAPPGFFWRGASIDTRQRMLDTLAAEVGTLRFISLEPLLEPVDLWEFFKEAVRKPEWVIVGPENGSSPARVTMQREWVYDIKAACMAYGVPLFMKSGAKNGPGVTYTKELMGSDFIQQYPSQYIKSRTSR
jgi:protein gp37